MNNTSDLELFLNNVKEIPLDSISCGNNKWKVIYPSETKHEEIKSPIDGSVTCKIIPCVPADVNSVVSLLKDSSEKWKMTPAPKRGEVIRRISELIRKHKQFIANLITLESGKTKQESLGEVQEWIDICDFAVGLSRQLYGLTIATERVNHRLMEQWHPLGVVGIISSFNFPIAIWAWNAMLALVCGNVVLWKPSEKTPLCSFFANQIVTVALEEEGFNSLDISAVIYGDYSIGKSISQNKNINLVSATGSTEMGIEVSSIISNRLGKSLLELGGNNAMIVTGNADLELAIRAITFSATGTSGQRCTTLRRLFLHRSIPNDFIERLINIFNNVKVGDPREDGILMGPLRDGLAQFDMQRTLEAAAEWHDCKVFGGERVIENVPEGGYYVKPAIVIIPEEQSCQPDIMRTETFAPILYIMRYDTLEEAIKLNNDCSYGLSSSIFTNDLRESELFLSSIGSDCGIANVNVGTSGAEIGGAFGGEKDSGGGRESGSDCWKNYMRRQTVTINYGKELPLSQGIKFEFN